MGENVEYSTSFTLAPGEKDVYGCKVMPSLMIPYLKGELMCSSTRFVYKVPNTLLGLIPMGYNENTMPLKNLASAAIDLQFKPLRCILGLILAVVGFAQLTANFGFIIIVLLGIGLLLTSFPTRLTVTNPAGGKSEVLVSILDKGRVSTFKEELQQRIFADQSALHHAEAMNLQTMQLIAQQQQLQALNNLNQHGTPQQAPQPQNPANPQ